MKLVKLFSFFIIGFSFMSFTTLDCANNTATHTNIYSSVKWKTDAVELGEIPLGKPVTIEFEFTNTSNADVIVANAQASCGCTVADYPKTPIAAGKTAKITATFNAAAKGVFTKNVTVTIQNEEAKVLNFKGTVI
jgi:outer membrane lipoprotein SlyB